MPRPAKFSTEQILDQVVSLVAESGPQRATVGAVAKSIGAPSGSIYHRFATRDLMMAKAWIRTVRRAQEGFIEQLSVPDVRAAAHGGTLHIPRWCRANEADARLLLLYRRDQLAEAWPEELADELAELNSPLARALEAFLPRLSGRLTRTKREAAHMVLFDLPYGVSRRHLLNGSPPPTSSDRLLTSVCDAMLFPGAGTGNE